jgi:protein-disulfide isomerase
MIKNMNADAEVSIVDDMTEVVRYGVMATPAIVVDDKIVHIGSMPKEDELKNWL